MELNIIEITKNIIYEFYRHLRCDLNKIHKHIYDDALYFKVINYVLNFPRFKIIEKISSKYKKEIQKKIKYYTFRKEWNVLSEKCKSEIIKIIFKYYYNFLYSELKYSLRSDKKDLQNPYNNYLAQYNDYNYK